MKLSVTIIAILLSRFLFGQKAELFKNIVFDSSYAVFGVGLERSSDSALPQFWFIVDNPENLNELKKDWVFNQQPLRISVEEKCIVIFVTKEKRLISNSGLIFPISGAINIEDHWYKLDTTRLQKLHLDHPLRYHTEKLAFDSAWKFYSYYYNVKDQPSFLFAFEPHVKYEGKFVVTMNRSLDPASPIFALKDLNEQLADLAPAKSFKASIVENDSFNVNSKNKVNLTVECSKSLYDKFKNKRAKKGEWQPSLFETKIYWRD